MNASDLKDKVVLITGASSGIGRGCALMFAGEGCQLAITALAGDPMGDLNEVHQLCVSKGIPKKKVLAIEGDVTKDEDCQRIVSTTVDHFKKLDVLVNCAGVGYGAMLENTSMEMYDLIMDLNLKSVCRMTQLCLPHITPTKGNIVNISSVASFVTCKNLCAYGVSKAGVNHLTKTVALEVAEAGVRVNAVCPGVTKTNIFQRWGRKEEEMEKFYEERQKQIPLGRVGMPEDVAKLVVFLASDLASYITGACIPVDGGRMLFNRGSL